MASENPSWGERRIADELSLKLKLLVDPRTVGKYDAFNFGYRENEQTWIGNTGNGLGWGIGASTGVKLGAADRQVVCSIGDESMMYSASGFLTQVRHSVPVLTVVWNNHNYLLVII